MSDEIANAFYDHAGDRDASVLSGSMVDVTRADALIVCLGKETVNRSPR